MSIYIFVLFSLVYRASAAQITINNTATKPTTIFKKCDNARVDSTASSDNTFANHRSNQSCTQKVMSCYNKTCNGLYNFCCKKSVKQEEKIKTLNLKLFGVSRQLSNLNTKVENLKNKLDQVKIQKNKENDKVYLLCTVDNQKLATELKPLDKRVSKQLYIPDSPLPLRTNSTSIKESKRPLLLNHDSKANKFLLSDAEKSEMKEIMNDIEPCDNKNNTTKRATTDSLHIYQSSKKNLKDSLKYKQKRSGLILNDTLNNIENYNLSSMYDKENQITPFEPNTYLGDFPNTENTDNKNTSEN